MYSKVKTGLNYYFNGLKYSKFIIVYACAGDIMFYNCKYNPRRIYDLKIIQRVWILCYLSAMFSNLGRALVYCAVPKEDALFISYDATYINN